MIARIWRGVTRESDKETYFEYLQQTGLKEYAAIPGNQGVWVLRHVRDGEAEFTLMSLWESWDAIKAFAGADYEKAVYYPEDERFLLHLDSRVTHYEVISSPLLQS
jgi:heme-degrading monooxygenase HmoA